jgi:protein-tyrosine phosphatase
MTLRTLLAVLLVSTALPAQAAVTEAQVERTPAGALRVTWTAAPGEPVDVLLAEVPEAPAARMRLVSDDDRDGVHEFAAPAGERAYVLLRGADGGEVRAAERVLPLQGATNFRDVGGYRTADGRRVRWGVIYRSAELSGLTAADQAFLNELGVRTIVDLRSTSERTSQPTALSGPTIVSHDYRLDISALAPLFRPGADGEQARVAMTTFYPAMLDSHGQHFRDVFQALLEGQGPVLYHCSAGKDRTGVTTALVLSALGVPRETIVADYLLSNRYYRLAPEAASARAADPSLRAFASLPPEVARVLGGVEPEYLLAVFAEIDRRGGVDAYLATLGVGPAEVAKLKTAYLD